MGFRSFFEGRSSQGVRRLVFVAVAVRKPCYNGGVAGGWRRDLALRPRFAFGDPQPLGRLQATRPTVLEDGSRRQPAIIRQRFHTTKIALGDSPLEEQSIDPAVVAIVVLVLLAVVLVIWFMVRSNATAQNEADAAARRLSAAKSAYYRSIQELTDDPINAELRQRALYLGRAYSSLTREDESVTTYDELAIKNDLDAACAGAGNRPRQSERQPAFDYDSPATNQLGTLDRAAAEALGLVDERPSPRPAATQQSTAGVELTLSCECGAKITVSSKLGGKAVRCP